MLRLSIGMAIHFELKKRCKQTRSLVTIPAPFFYEFRYSSVLTLEFTHFLSQITLFGISE